jgi:hypothetical protein
MSTTTYGACAQRLHDNGYFPCSMTRPDHALDYRIADDAAGILAIPDYYNCPLADFRERRVVGLVITAQDAKLRAKILSVLKARGLAAGPARTDSGRHTTHVLRYDDTPEFRRTTEASKDYPGPTVILESCERLEPGRPAVSAIIPMTGEWINGSPLTVKRSDLPSIRNDGIETLFDDLRDAFPAPVWVNPDPVVAASAPRELRTARRRDLFGQPNLIAAFQAAVDAGEAIWLPDLKPGENVDESSRPRKSFADSRGTLRDNT